MRASAVWDTGPPDGWLTLSRAAGPRGPKPRLEAEGRDSRLAAPGKKNAPGDPQLRLPHLALLPAGS